MDNKIFKYNALEVHLDTSDYLVMERIQTAKDTHLERIAQPKSDNNVLEFKRIVIILTDFIDAVCGEGSSKKALGASITSLDEVTALTDALNKFIIEQGDRRSEIMKKYSPKRNV
ncbi:hypothetical protein AGMMS49975_22580 [Clostridia bacterium]|nr:hypothetical protein AGMMS49975_22580 [Clostridia bacterium]